jgi:hypothetical protein
MLLTMMATLPEEAAAVTYGLAGVVTSTVQRGAGAPDFTGTLGGGSMSFDENLITGAGNEVVGGDDLEIDFSLLGQTFTGSDHAAFDSFGVPSLLLQDGRPRAVAFRVSETDFFNPTAIATPKLIQFTLQPFVPLVEVSQDNFGAEIHAVSAIPLPAGLPLALAGAAALGFFGRRRRAA